MADEKPQAGAQAGDDEGADGGTGSGQKKNPLYDDLMSYKNRARAAEAENKALKDAEAARQAAATAKSADDYTALQKRLQAEHDAKVRRLDLQSEGINEGIDPAFLLAADDGTSDIPAVIAKAKAKQEAYNKRVGAGNGQAQDPVHGVTSASAGGKRIWKESEVAKLSKEDYRKHRADILDAQSEGRFLVGK